jgi:hypothetical protein
MWHRTPLLFALSLLLLGAGLLAPAQPASAGRGWCKADPVIMVDGQLADVFVGSSLDMLLKATGPIKVEILMPTGSKGAVVLTDLGFGHGYDIVFTQTSTLTRTATHTQVRVRVYAPATSSSLPVTVTFAPRTLSSSLTSILFGSSTDGVANSWVSLTTK